MNFLRSLNLLFAFVIVGLVVFLGSFLFSVLPEGTIADRLEVLAPQEIVAKEVIEKNVPIIQTRSKEGFPRSSLYVPPEPETKKKLKRLPLFQINNLSAHDLSDEVMIVNFFAVWCPKCANEMPLLYALSTEDNIPIYGVNVKMKETDDVDGFFQENGDPFKKWGKDDFNLISQGLNIASVPLTMIITKDKRIHWSLRGELTQSVIDKEMRPILKALSAKVSAP